MQCVCVHARLVNPGFVQHIMANARILPKDITRVQTFGRSYASPPLSLSLLYFTSSASHWPMFRTLIFH